MRIPFFVGVALLLFASLSAAQPVLNPTIIEFQSPDHETTVTRYDIGYFAGTASEPTQVVSVSKAAFTPQPDGYWRFTPLPRPVLGNYTAKVRSFGLDASTTDPSDEITAGWSTPSGPFLLSPATAAGLRVQP